MNWEECMSCAKKMIAEEDKEAKRLSIHVRQMKNSLRFFEEQLRLGIPFPVRVSRPKDFTGFDNITLPKEAANG